MTVRELLDRVAKGDVRDDMRIKVVVNVDEGAAGAFDWDANRVESDDVADVAVEDGAVVIHA